MFGYCAVVLSECFLEFNAEQVKDRMLPLALEVSQYLRGAYSAHLLGNVSVSRKADRSFLTAADTHAHKMITTALIGMYPEIPVVSEEGDHLCCPERDTWDYYWLVDPLDGTSEFVEKTGEFTVNIALMKHNKPWLGFVVLPQVDRVYAGGDTLEPVVYDQNNWWPCRDPSDDNTLKLVISGRAANSDAIAKFKERLQAQGTQYELVFLGSAYKYCELLKHRYAIYPRYGLTSHWDTAAGQALLGAAGGAIVISSGQDLSYPSSTLLNSPFLALSSGCAQAKQEWLTLF